MNASYLIYLVIAIIVIVAIYKIIIPLCSKTKKLKEATYSKLYIDNNASLSDEQYKKLSVGAIYSQQQTAYVNSLTTGLGKSQIQNLLSYQWDINNTKEAEESLDNLENKGIRYYFDAVYDAFLSNSPNEQKSIIVSGFRLEKGDTKKAYYQFQNLVVTWDELKNYDIVRSKEELKQYNNLGWDCGRLVFLSRLCYDAGYISEDLAWQYIDEAYELVADNFDDWNSFSKSYIIGQAMSKGTESSHLEVITIANYLLQEEISPWARFKL